MTIDIGSLQTRSVLIARAQVNGDTSLQEVQARFIPQEAIDAARIDLETVPEDQYQAYVEQERQSLDGLLALLQDIYTERTAMPANDLLTRPYATVEAGGKLLASIDNQGVITTDAALEGGLARQIQQLGQSASGPSLAAQVADLLARQLGGKVNRSASALSQASYQQLVDQRNAATTATVRTADMQKDEMYKQIQSRQEYLNQIAARRAARGQVDTTA
jgi:hypothetical protein